MPQHRRLTRPGAIHPIGYWQDTDPALDGPVTDGVHWFDTSAWGSSQELVETIRVGDEWIVAPGGGTVRTLVVAVGNGFTGVGAGDKEVFPFRFPVTLLGWTVISPDAGTPSVAFDLRTVLLASYTGAGSGSSIVGSTPPKLVTESVHSSLDVSGWTPAIAAATALIVAVTGSTACTRATLALLYRRSV